MLFVFVVNVGCGVGLLMSSLVVIDGFVVVGGNGGVSVSLFVSGVVGFVVVRSCC